MNKAQFKTWLAGKIYEIKECSGLNQSDIIEIRDEIDKMVSREIAKIGIHLDILEGSEFWGIADNPKATPRNIADALAMPFREVSEIQREYQRYKKRKSEIQKETERFLNANKTL